MDGRLAGHAGRKEIRFDLLIRDDSSPGNVILRLRVRTMVGRERRVGDKASCFPRIIVWI